MIRSYLFLLFSFLLMSSFVQNAMTVELGGLVLYFSFEEQKPVDHSSNPVKITSITGNLKNAEGKFGRAGDFDGSTFIEVEHADKLEGMEALTIEAWIKISKVIGDGMAIVSKRKAFNSADVYNLFIYTGTKMDARVNAQGDFWSQTAFKAGEWYHVAYVFDGKAAGDQRQKMYVNGILESKASHAHTTVQKGGASLWVGELDSARGFKWNGLIDELGIWNVALDENQINQVMKVGKAKMLAVEPSTKLATTWGKLRIGS